MAKPSKFRRIRLQEGLTQPELARQAGVSVKTIARAETGENLKDVTWHRILKALNSFATDTKYELSDIRPRARS